MCNRWNLDNFWYGDTRTHSILHLPANIFTSLAFSLCSLRCLECNSKRYINTEERIFLVNIKSLVHYYYIFIFNSLKKKRAKRKEPTKKNGTIFNMSNSRIRVGKVCVYVSWIIPKFNPFRNSNFISTSHNNDVFMANNQNWTKCE